MDHMGAAGDIMRRTESFVSSRIVDLVIDENQCDETEVDTGIPQATPVLPILFANYFSGVLREVEKDVEGCVAT